jgi:hypothetical protein
MTEKSYVIDLQGREPVLRSESDFRIVARVSLSQMSGHFPGSYRVVAQSLKGEEFLSPSSPSSFYPSSFYFASREALSSFHATYLQGSESENSSPKVSSYYNQRIIDLSHNLRNGHIDSGESIPHGGERYSGGIPGN